VKLFKIFILKELIRASTTMKANIDTLQIDVLKNSVNDYLDKDLTKPKKIDSKSCIAFSKKYSCVEVASNFLTPITTANP